MFFYSKSFLNIPFIFTILFLNSIYYARIDKGDDIYMRIGMPTLTKYPKIHEQIQICHELGLNLLELNLNYPYCDLENNDLDELLALSQQYDVAFSIHYDEYANFASFQEEIREAWIQHFKKTVILASKIKALRITIHLFEGVHITLPHDKIYVNDMYFDQYISLLLASLKECFEFSQKHGIDLCIENVAMPDFMVKTFKTLFTNQFHFTYDCGHHYEFEFKALPLYEKHWDLVKHIHLHDVIGTSPHKALGTGILDVKQILKIARQHNIDIIIEVKTLQALKESVAYLKNNAL